MSSVNLSTVKNELKTIGCKLKSQLDGSWAICEPKGVRVIVPTLEDVNLYYLGKMGQAQTVKQDETRQAPEVTPTLTPVTSLQSRIEESRSKPNPFMDAQVAVPPKKVVHAAVKTPEKNIQEPVKQAVVSLETEVVSRITEQKLALPAMVAKHAQPELKLSDLRVELKSLGCQLKSQLDGSWCICEPRGARVIVPTLEAVKAYYVGKTSGHAAQSEPASEKITEFLTPAEPVVESIKHAPLPADSHIAEQQKMAIAAVNSFIGTMKEKRLARGLNFLHSEIKPSLLKHGCPEALMDKAYNYAEAKLYKDCMDKVLVKHPFENHAQKNDVMYFDSKYAHLLAKHA